MAGGRSRKHEVKVSETEADLLAAKAAGLGVSVPRLLVECALSPVSGETSSERRAAMAELFAVHRLLAAVSNNVNQMARVANSTKQIAAREELVAMASAVRQVAARVDGCVEVIGAIGRGAKRR